MRGWRAWSLAGAVAAAATTAMYVGVIASEGDNSVWDVLPWVALMVLGAAAALWSGLSRTVSVGRSMGIVAVVVLAGLGVLAIFSIGIGFLVAALLAGVGAARAVHPAT